MTSKLSDYLEHFRAEEAKTVRPPKIRPVVASGGSTAIQGRRVQRDEEQVRLFRSGKPTLKPQLVAHPEAAAAADQSVGAMDPKYCIPTVGKEDGSLRCMLCGVAHANPALGHCYRQCPRCSFTLVASSLLHEQMRVKREVSRFILLQYAYLYSFPLRPAHLPSPAPSPSPSH